MKLVEKKGLFYRFTSRHLLIFYLLGIISYLALGKIEDPDIWWHLRTGQYIIEEGVFPFQNIFSYSASSHIWIAYSWLTEIIFYNISLLGLNWLIFFKAFLIVSTFTIVLNITYRASHKNFNLSVLITSLMAYISSGSWLERPQLFSFLFTAFFVYILRAFEYEEKKLLWFIPLITFLWVDLHIYFVVGIGMLFIYLFSSLVKEWNLSGEEKEKEKRKRRTLAKVTVVSLLVCFINPYTYRIFLEVFRLASEQWARKNVMELQSPNFHHIRNLFFEVMLFLSIFSLSISKRRPSLVDLVLFFGFTYQALYAIRDLPFWCIVVAPILCSHLGDTFIYFKKNQHLLKNEGKINISQARIFLFIDNFLKRFYPFINWFLAGILIGVIFSRFPIDKSPESCVGKGRFPIQAVKFIKENNISGEMFNPFNWGGYLIYTLYPEWKVSVDGRTQSYGDTFLEDYDMVHNLSIGWEKKFEKYNANFVLWMRKSPLTEVFLLMEDWKLVYSDDMAVIFIKNIPQNREIIDKYEENAKINMQKSK